MGKNSNSPDFLKETETPYTKIHHEPGEGPTSKKTIIFAYIVFIFIFVVAVIGAALRLLS